MNAIAVCRPAGKHGGVFSTSSRKLSEGPSYQCLRCGRRTREDSSEDSEETVISSTESAGIQSRKGSREAFFDSFDLLAETDIDTLELTIEHGPPQWRSHKEPRRYQLGFSERWKRLFADLTTIAGKELGRALLDDAHKLAEDVKAEELFVAVSLRDPERVKVVRNLLVYGFEKLESAEAAQLTSNPDVMVLKMEINQEDDFVDLD